MKNLISRLAAAYAAIAGMDVGTPSSDVAKHVALARVLLIEKKRGEAQREIELAAAAAQVSGYMYYQSDIAALRKQLV